jgi:hypothetical protein
MSAQCVGFWFNGTGGEVVGSPIISVPAVRATLAANVKACLGCLEWSESELSRRSGVSQKQVNNIVRERNGCGVEALALLGRALGVPYWLLLMPNLGQAVADGQTIGEGS